MHVPRGLAATIGTSTALMLGATASLSAVSGVVAAQGWPGIDDEERPAARLVPGRVPHPSLTVVLGSPSARVPVRLADPVTPRRTTRRRARPAAPSDYGAPAPAASPPSV